MEYKSSLSRIDKRDKHQRKLFINILWTRLIDMFQRREEKKMIKVMFNHYEESTEESIQLPWKLECRSGNFSSSTSFRDFKYAIIT